MMRETDEDKRLDALKRKSAAAVRAKLAEIEIKRSFGCDGVTDNVTDKCHACGCAFTPNRTDSKYCSGKYRQKAYRQRST